MSQIVAAASTADTSATDPASVGTNLFSVVVMTFRPRERGRHPAQNSRRPYHRTETAAESASIVDAEAAASTPAVAIPQASAIATAA
jgi:hypothetical protein